MKVLLPYIPLRMLPHATQFVGDKVKEVVFITRPNFTKVELKNYLEQVYNFSIDHVSTCNYEGKKKAFQVRSRGSSGGMRQKFYRRPDFKKAYVVFKARHG